MYYIRKYADCWAIHNDDNGKSRPLSEKEVVIVQEQYPSLKDPQTCTVYADESHLDVFFFTRILAKRKGYEVLLVTLKASNV